MLGKEWMGEGEVLGNSRAWELEKKTSISTRFQLTPTGAL